MDYSTRDFDFKRGRDIRDLQYAIFIFSYAFMGMIRSLMIKLGLADLSADRGSITVMVLDDDERRHRWFRKRFAGDHLDIAATVEEAKVILSDASYDAIFLDHDLLHIITSRTTMMIFRVRVMRSRSFSMSVPTCNELRQ